MFESVNEIAILATALLAVAVGNVWYSPLIFGNPWMKAIGIVPGDDVLPQREMFIAVLKGVIAHAVYFFVIALIVNDVGHLISIWLIASSLTILIATQMVAGVVWEKRSLAYFLVNVGYIALITFGGIGVIMFWPW